MAACAIASPAGGLVCSRRQHSAAIAHHARGAAPDGTQWAMFWWDPGQVPPGEQPPSKVLLPAPRPAAE